MAQYPQLINYPLHEHPLELMEPMSVYPEHNGEWKCDNCLEHQPNSKRPYHCRTCQFDVCSDCALPLSHPRHPDCNLFLVNMNKIYPMYQGRWKCDGCEANQLPSLGYRCFQHQFDLCQQCFTGQSLAIHRHPLIPADAARLYGNSDGWWACDTCKRQGTEMNSRISWHCSFCEFDCCKDCLLEVKVPLHPHPLKLTDPMIPYGQHQGGWKCDVCERNFNEEHREPRRGRPYHCTTCQYDVCHQCIGSLSPDNPIDVTGPFHAPRPRPVAQNTAHQPPIEIADDEDVPEDLDDNEKCVVCYLRPKNATIVHGPTGHVCCCLSCAYTLRRKGDSCPICRAPIDTVIKHYVIS